MSDPFWDPWLVIIFTLLFNVRLDDSDVEVLKFTIFPANEKVLLFTVPPIPFPFFPSVTIYWTVITESFSNFLPILPSPNNNSYFWSCTSCIKYIREEVSTLKIFSTNVYSVPRPVSFKPFTYTLIVEVSIPLLSNKNLWSNEALTVNTFVKNIPSLILILLNEDLYWSWLF